MKANELMIGDWVSWENVGLEMWQETQIKELQADHCHLEYLGGDPVYYDEIKPIPLSPEILEKNGFKDISDHTLKGAETFRLTMGDGNIQLTYKLGDYFAYDYHDDRWYRQYQTNLCHGWCVHNLQHALKDCGIDKEITL